MDPISEWFLAQNLDPEAFVKALAVTLLLAFIVAVATFFKKRT
jgi:hypothetical protein